MFEQDPEIAGMVDRLYEITESLDRGDVLLNKFISEVTGEDHASGRSRHVVKKVRKRLREDREIETYVRPGDVGIGVRLLTEEEQLNLFPRWKAKKETTQLKQAVKGIGAISDKRLSNEKRRLRNHLLRETRTRLSQTRAFIRDCANPERVYPTLPIRPEFREKAEPGGEMEEAC